MAVRKRYRAAQPAVSPQEGSDRERSSMLRMVQKRHRSKKRSLSGSLLAFIYLIFRKLFGLVFGRTGIRVGFGQPGRGKKFLHFLGRAAVVAAIGGFFLAAAVFIYFSKDIPDPSRIADRSVNQSTQIFDRTGAVLLYQIHGDEKRTVVPLSQISPNLIHATIATEDKNFYHHPGIDIKGIARALFKDIIRGEKAQGASTITQQLIKNSVLSSEKTATRKIKEIILALETEQKFSKDQILEMYLNQIPYGSNLYGVQVASETFFGKSANELDIAQAAMIAAIPQSATYYFPYGAHPDALEARRKYVISQMLSEGYITAQQADEAKAEDVFAQLKPFVSDIKAPHFVMYIKDQLVDEYGQDTVEKGGLKVYTTLDYDLQQIAEDAVKKGVEYNAKAYNASNAALVATDPRTGQILAMVGSKDYFDIKGQGNVNVATANRQPGSSFKPFVYATAFAKGYTPNTILYDVPTSFGPDGSGKDFEPKNYNLQYNGPVTIRSALGRSLNIPAVKALYLAGIKSSIDTAHAMGITTLNNDTSRYGLSLVLGTGEVKLLDMTGAYGVFANDGKKNDPSGVLKVEDAKGKILKEFSSTPKQVIDTEVARNITSILSDNAARTPTFGSRSKLYFPDRPVAAKTGTTSDYKDAWTVGYTPGLAAGVWAGNNSGKVMNAGGGVSAATPIWNDFLTRALQGKPVEQFTAPQPITTNKAVLNGAATSDVTLVMDKACGGEKLAGDNTPEDQKIEKAYKEVHTILYFCQKDDPRGDRPKNPAQDPQFARWESGVLAWARANGQDGINEAVPTEVCGLRGSDNAPVVKISSPFNNQILGNDSFNFSAEAYSFFGIQQMEFYLDDNLLKVDSESPYEGSYRFSGSLENGVHVFKAKAYDKIGNAAAKEISVIVNSGSGQGKSSVYLKPVSSGDFPLELEAAVNATGVEKVTFYYQLDSIYDADMNLVSKPGAAYDIGEADQASAGAGNLYSVSWEEDKSYFISGRYRLWATLETDQGKRVRSNEQYVEIR